MNGITMWILHRFFRYTFLLVIGLIISNFTSGHSGNITLDNNRLSLTAPEAQSYQWYFNGEETDLTGQSIQILAPGTYQVILTSPEGVIEYSSTTVSVNSEGRYFTIYLIGDSTVSGYTPEYYPLTGWGQVLPFFFDSTIIVKNLASSGRSAKSFYNDLWDPIRESFKPGDFVFIQFGINDGHIDDPDRYTEPFTTFQEYLTRFINEAREKGAFPVLVTTVRQNYWNKTQPYTLYPTYGNYPVATRELAGTLGVPLIDLNQRSVIPFESLGPDYTGSFIYMNLEPGEYENWPDGKIDNSHFQEMGAIEISRLVVEAIADLSEDTIMNRLIPYIKPQVPVATSVNFPDGATITHTASYPEGLRITLKAILNSEYELVEWRSDEGIILGTDTRIDFVMGKKDQLIEAILQKKPMPDCAGVLDGKAYIDDCDICVGGTTGKLPCSSDINSGNYKITSEHSGYCIEEIESVTQAMCLNSVTQLWEFIPEGSFYKIKNAETGMYLYCETLSAGSKISSGEEAILWRIEKTENQTVLFVPKEDPQLILEVPETIDSGEPLKLNIRIWSENQEFRLSEVFPDCAGVYYGKAYMDDCDLCVEGTTGKLPCSSDITSGNYKITSEHSGYCIEEIGSVTQEMCLNSVSQLWEFLPEGSFYKIKNAETGMYLYCETLSAGSKISSGEEAILWRIEKTENQMVQFVPKEDPQLILEVPETIDAGDNLKLNFRILSDNQVFEVSEALPSTYVNKQADNLRPKIFPNPLSSDAEINFGINIEYPIKLEIFNQQGIKVFQRVNITEESIRFGSDLSSGIYLVKVSDRKLFRTIIAIKE